MFASEVRSLCAQFTGRVYVQKQRLNGGGYTDDGIYFGIGEPLFLHKMRKVSGAIITEHLVEMKR